MFHWREEKSLSDNRLGVIGIVVENRDAIPQVNQVLTNHASMIIGRMGLPYRQKDLAVIALIVDGSTDELGALTGKLGNISGDWGYMCWSSALHEETQSARLVPQRNLQPFPRQFLGLHGFASLFEMLRTDFLFDRSYRLGCTISSCFCLRCCCIFHSIFFRL